MKRMFVLVVIVCLFSVLSCQNKIALEKDYATTVNGKITKPSFVAGGGARQPVIGAVVSDGVLSTTSSDTSGQYSLTIYHNGSFILQINDGTHIYNEVISTKEEVLTKNFNF